MTTDMQAAPTSPPVQPLDPIYDGYALELAAETQLVENNLRANLEIGEMEYALPNVLSEYRRLALATLEAVAGSTDTERPVAVRFLSQELERFAGELLNGARAHRDLSRQQQLRAFQATLDRHRVSERQRLHMLREQEAEARLRR